MFNCHDRCFPETFLQLQRNGIVNVKPDAVHFDGFIVGRISHKILVSTILLAGPGKISFVTDTYGVFPYKFLISINLSI